MRIRHALNRLLLSGLAMAFLLGPGTSAWAGDAADPSTVLSFQQGVKAYRQGDYEAAINYMRRVVALDPGHTHARYYLAVSLDQVELDGEAVPQYRYVAEHSEDDRLLAYVRKRLEILQPAEPAASSEPSSLVAAASASSVPGTAKLASRIVVPLKSNRNALMVDGLILNDQAGRRAYGTFIIDTGATYTSISREMAEKLGLDLERCEHVRITTANGRIEVPKVVIDRLSVNGLEARNVEATVIDVRKGSSFHGLLGLSFIRQFVLTIDPGANHLIFQKN